LDLANNITPKFTLYKDYTINFSSSSSLFRSAWISKFRQNYEHLRNVEVGKEIVQRNGMNHGPNQLDPMKKINKRYLNQK